MLVFKYSNLGCRKSEERQTFGHNITAWDFVIGPLPRSFEQSHKRSFKRCENTYIPYTSYPCVGQAGAMLYVFCGCL
eukprot:3960127-Amphidinium_carterae.1